MAKIEAKQKEPNLSQETIDIIQRSFGKQNNAGTDELIRYKHKIMEILLSNEDLLKTLHYTNAIETNNVLNGDYYRNVCVFDFLRLPDFKENVKNYVCFEFRESNPFDSHITRRLIFRVVSHLDEMITDWGVSRVDLLACIIKNEFNWSNELGMTLIKQYDEPSMADDDYYYREISYKIEVPNELYNKINNVKF